MDKNKKTSQWKYKDQLKGLHSPANLASSASPLANEAGPVCILSPLYFVPHRHSLSIYVRPLPVIFISRPRIGPEITWSGPGPPPHPKKRYLGLPPPPKNLEPEKEMKNYGISTTIHTRQESQCLLYAEFSLNCLLIVSKENNKLYLINNNFNPGLPEGTNYTK